MASHMCGHSATHNAQRMLTFSLSQLDCNILWGFVSRLVPVKFVDMDKVGEMFTGNVHKGIDLPS